MNDFAVELSKKLRESQLEDHVGNYDASRFGEEVKSQGWPRLREGIGSLARKTGLFRSYLTRKTNLSAWSPQFPGLEWMFQKLEDDESRRLLVDVIAYRIMGYRRVRLPLSTPRFWEQFAECAALADEQDVIGNRADGFRLLKHRLDKIGYPISIYMPKGGPLTTYVLGQYAYGKAKVGVRPGYVVIDAGACWGDTALHFAHSAGTSGKIYSFEFIPDNIEVFERNIALNPSLADRIELIARPLWSSSNIPMSNSGLGPGSSAIIAQGSDDTMTLSLSIDDFVKQRSLSHVDFIKMDIEGAEFEALQGAAQTLMDFKPQLALCVYHSVDDFSRLARYLDDLRLGYRFYLGHFTIHAEETVLFATARA